MVRHDFHVDEDNCNCCYGDFNDAWQVKEITMSAAIIVIMKHNI